MCTNPPDPSGFPVKVVLLVDQSGSMCISDPPGSQGTAGLCEQFATAVGDPDAGPGPGAAGAHRAVRDPAQRPGGHRPLRHQREERLAPGGHRAALRPAHGIDTYLQNLQAELGKGTDYQGALAYAYGVIAADIADTNTTNRSCCRGPATWWCSSPTERRTPAARPTTTCRQYADPNNPELIWADSLPDYCNLTDAAGHRRHRRLRPGHRPQPELPDLQLRRSADVAEAAVQRRRHPDAHRAALQRPGRGHLQALGLLCQDIYGVYPNTAPADYPPPRRRWPSWLLQQMAARGNGVFQEFRNQDIQNLGLGALDYTSLAARTCSRG